MKLINLLKEEITGQEILKYSKKHFKIINSRKEPVSRMNKMGGAQYSAIWIVKMTIENKAEFIKYLKTNNFKKHANKKGYWLTNGLLDIEIAQESVKGKKQLFIRIEQFKPSKNRFSMSDYQD